MQNATRERTIAIFNLTTTCGRGYKAVAFRWLEKSSPTPYALLTAVLARFSLLDQTLMLSYRYNHIPTNHLQPDLATILPFQPTQSKKPLAANFQAFPSSGVFHAIFSLFLWLSENPVCHFLICGHPQNTLYYQFYSSQRTTFAHGRSLQANLAEGLQLLISERKRDVLELSQDTKMVMRRLF